MKWREVFLFASVVVLAGCGGSGGGSHHQSFKVLFIRDGDIWSAEADGSNAQQITDTPEFERDPTGSPDGTKIVYSVTDGVNSYRIKVMNADGSNPTFLTDTGHVDITPQYNLDGTKIVFSSNRSDANNYEIDIVDADGDNLTRLTDDAHSETDPIFVPSGQIVFSQISDTGAKLTAMQPDGSDQVPIDSSITWSSEPQLMPNGERVLFRSEDESDGQIATMKPDGTDVKLLTPDTEICYACCALPNGKIIFSTATGNIDIIDVNGNHRETFITDASNAGILPVFAH